MPAAYVWSSLRRLGVPAADLEDVTHDVFLQVHRRLGQYDASRPVRPWLFGFAYRRASQHRRRAHRRHEIPGEPDTATHPGVPPDRQLSVQEDRKLVLLALEAMGMDRRAVFVLHEIDQVPMSDIATSLGIPVNTAYSRLRIARAEFAVAVRRLRVHEGRP
ncbi:MAG: sigma-70 family RNA polymerase sigma factor [Polyangiaceae bacterium]|jgi:RNA polymerase sigma-70 factor, ECF subfamily